MEKEVLDWLLEPNNPSVRFRTLTELLDKPSDDPVVQDAHRHIPTSKAVTRIFDKMSPEGYWEQKGIGAGVEYKDYSTTHFVLSFLAELGMNRDDPRIAQAVERYLSFQQPDGDFYRHFSCLYGYNLRTLILLGYDDDPRTRKIVDLMLTMDRPDGGYLCDMHEGKYKTRATKSCIRGSTKVLLGYAMLPELWGTSRCQQLTEYFLRRNVYFRMDNLAEAIRWEVTATVYPITWRSSLLELLYALSVMGYGEHPALAQAWAQLDTKRDEQGRYHLDWTPTNIPFKVGKRGEANKWVTLYAYLATKHREKSD